MKIVVTGAGIVSSLGFGKEVTLQALLDERSGISVPEILGTAHTEHPVGEVKMTTSALAEYARVHAGEPVSRTSLLGLCAAREALQQADIADVSEVAFINGTTVGGMEYTEQHWHDREQYAQMITELHTAGASTEHIALHIGQFACTTTISTACSSALNAVIAACNMLRTGRCKQALVGGAECLSLFHFNGFRSLQILATEPCRPFSANRQGLNLGEGAAYLVIETEESALQRNVPILAYIAGYGNACDAFHQTASSENGEGAYLAMKQALAMANLSPADIDYINAHGTATPNNDASEFAAMLRLFADQMPAFSSTKAFTGHTTSAAGSIELVISLLALQHAFLPANLNWQEPMPEAVMPNLHTQRAELSHVLCNSFGFGGNDSSLILSKHAHSLSEQTEPVDYTVLADVEVDAEADYKQYISPLQARRLSPTLRRLVIAAYKALEQANCNQVDAVITGTDLGCICYSVTLLNQLIQEGEDALKPSLFMQSTHNTPSSLIAILMHNNCYNCTYSHGKDSYSHAMTDATTQIQLGNIQSALVLGFEELDETWQQLETSVGKEHASAARATIITKR